MIALARRYRPKRFSDLLVQDHVANVPGFMGQTTGFEKSMLKPGVTILAEFAEFSNEIDIGRARHALSQADASDPEGVAAAKRAQARLRAAGEAE